MNEKVITLFPPEAADHDPTYTPHRCGTWGELLNDIAWEIDHGNHTQAAQRLREFAADFRDLPLPEEQETHPDRSEEHTSELQSRGPLVCRLLLEKKNARTRSRT